MVQLEEVEDDELDQAQPGPLSIGEDDDDFTDTDSSISDDDLPVLTSSDESLTERLLALRDMLPPSTRRRIASTTAAVTGYVKTGLLYGGKTLWVVSTSALLLGVPFAFAFADEQQVVEMEKEQRMREMGNELLTPGAAATQGRPAL
ncbi:MAG: hypothetical protein LQ347_006865 [Umbilicaria vellea]|nr:MAG: hypothetical protein LQ347_006865 [Umbilicaria vellea]